MSIEAQTTDPSFPRTAQDEHRHEQARSEFEEDVLSGLRGQKKSLPCKYFYDTRGSELFEKICETPEYYVTRTELALLRDACPQISPLIGPSADVLEPGSGAGEKIRLLLDSLDSPRSFIPIDISKSAVTTSAIALKRAYPTLDVYPIVADFTQPFELPNNFTRKSSHRKVIFFPGSTISNFGPNDAEHFLVGLRRVLSEGDFLLIGVDRIKARDVLELAYDDPGGVTAAFNLNLLERVARELDTNLKPETFSHRAVYNEARSRIEMHLVSSVEQSVRVGGETFRFAKEESIHTENSYKYSIEGFTSLARKAGFIMRNTFSDARDHFSIYLCQVPKNDS